MRHIDSPAGEVITGVDLNGNNCHLVRMLKPDQIRRGLGAGEQPARLMYGFPHVVSWLENDLENITTLCLEPAEGLQTPLEQADFLFHEFISGADLSYYERSHFMEPSSGGVWELKTADIRFFGWFYCKNMFIVANVDSAYRCKLHDLYEGFRTNTILRRETLDLDAPKVVIGGYVDVF